MLPSRTIGKAGIGLHSIMVAILVAIFHDAAPWPLFQRMKAGHPQNTTRRFGPKYPGDAPCCARCLVTLQSRNGFGLPALFIKTGVISTVMSGYSWIATRCFGHQRLPSSASSVGIWVGDIRTAVAGSSPVQQGHQIWLLKADEIRVYVGLLRLYLN